MRPSNDPHALAISVVCAVGELGVATVAQVRSRLVTVGYEYDEKTVRRLLDTLTNRGGGHLMRTGETWEVRP